MNDFKKGQSAYEFEAVELYYKGSDYTFDANFEIKFKDLKNIVGNEVVEYDDFSLDIEGLDVYVLDVKIKNDDKKMIDAIEEKIKDFLLKNNDLLSLAYEEKAQADIDKAEIYM